MLGSPTLTHTMDSIHSILQHWLVEHPAISHFEWKKGHTFGASPLFLTATMISYLALTFSLRRFSSSIPTIPATALRLISAAHSLILCLLSLLMAIGCSLSTFHQMPHYSWIFCFPSNRTPPRGPTFFWAHVFYLSKILEFVDTLLIILKSGSSRRRLSFLHVYHHAAVLVMCYLWLSTSQSLLPIGLVINACVHVLMYAYYLLCALERRPWWKRMVTDCQIVQFVTGFVASGVMWYYHLTGTGCSGLWGWFFNALFNATLLALFLDFHSSNYAQTKTPGIRKNKLL